LKGIIELPGMVFLIMMLVRAKELASGKFLDKTNYFKTIKRPVSKSILPVFGKR